MGVQCSPKTLQDAQDGPKTAQEGPKTPRQDSKRTPDGYEAEGLKADRKVTEAARGHWNY